MSVYGVEGTPGSGKTLYIISEVIVPFLEQKDSFGKPSPCHIYHNIEGLNAQILASRLSICPHWLAQYLHYLGKEDENGNIIPDIDVVRNFYKDENGEIRPPLSVFVIDEGQNYFSARDFKEDFSYRLIPYLSRHRHYKHTIFWVTQRAASLDITFRRQTEHMYRLQRLEKFGMKNTSKLSMYEGWDIDTGVEPYLKKTFTFPAKYYGVYQSYATSVPTKERRITHNVILNNKPLMATFIIVLILIIYQIFFAKPLTGTLTKVGNGTEAMGERRAQGLVPSASSEPIKDKSDICIKEIVKIGNTIKYLYNNGELKNGKGNYNRCDDI